MTPAVHRKSVKPFKHRTDPACASKRRYADQCAARAAAMISLSEVGNVEKLFVYRCGHCSGWHLTKNSQGRRWMVTIDNPVHRSANAQ